jgi:hypothetical protein
MPRQMIRFASITPARRAICRLRWLGGTAMVSVNADHWPARPPRRSIHHHVRQYDTLPRDAACLLPTSQSRSVSQSERYFIGIMPVQGRIDLRSREHCARYVVAFESADIDITLRSLRQTYYRGLTTRIDQSNSGSGSVLWPLKASYLVSVLAFPRPG